MLEAKQNQRKSWISNEKFLSLKDGFTTSRIVNASLATTSESKGD
jgi:hypothetical protein